MKRTLIATLATLFVASAAGAASITIDTDKATYLVGETITITATFDSTGAVGSVLDVTMNWNPATAFALNPTATFTLGSSSQIITAGINAGASNLTSFGGGLNWTGPPQSGCVLLGGGAGNTCIILNQVNLAGSFPVDAATLVGTLQLQASGEGLVGLNVSSLNAFGLTPVLGANLSAAEVVPIPEPTTAALLGLGLLGLGVAGRRR